MGGHLETASAVSAVVSAFHAGADLVTQIRKRSGRRKGEEFVKQKLLLEALESGEVQISQRYTAHFDEIGPDFMIGDDAGREQLLHVAIMMQSEVVRSLQIALQYETALLDLTRLLEDAVLSRRDTLTALDGLRDRLFQRRQSVQGPAVSIRPVGPRRLSVESTQTSQQVPTDLVPARLMISQPEGSSVGISRLFSVRGNSQRPSISAAPITRSGLSPSAEWLEPITQSLEQSSHLAPRQPEYELSAGDVPRPLTIRKAANSDVMKMPETRILHPALMIQPNVPLNVNAAARSEYSDEKIVVPMENGEDTTRSSCSSAIEIPGTLPSRHHHQHYSPRFHSSPDHSTVPPLSIVFPPSPLPSPAAVTSPDAGFPFHRGSVTSPLVTSTRSSSCSESESHRTNSISMPFTSVTRPIIMLDRPCKDNNYWGFCKGAWTARQDWRRAMQIQQVPTGLYNTKSTWRCRSCAFEGEVFGTKKPYQLDSCVLRAQESDVRYRFVFLAKSHAKRKQGKEDTTCFGCVICVSEGKRTSIFGNVETLCTHLAREHGKGDLSTELQLRNKCIVGRAADVEEEFDVNIPGGGESVNF